ncbi:MAG: class I SAM-dependent methyltransferase [Candidatus Kerfeldbacteria bacterium]|nr:class I SAM-dependent methyltransferase [Candidatus Kerfeldbacteria bacterium]
MPKQIDIFYSLPEVWDFCLEKIYNKKRYLAGLIGLFNHYNITNRSLILDAGCGSGFPSIDLVKKGYRIVATDKSSEMVRQIRLNAKKENVSIEAYNIMWSDLANRFEGVFDFGYCRGNSLVYAASWEQNWIVPQRSREEIYKAIYNFYKVLKPGGKMYVDITNKDEKPYQKNIGMVNTKQGLVKIDWQLSHDIKSMIRTWTITLNFLKTGKESKYSSYSYLLPHGELLDFFTKAGFKRIDKYVKVKGEGNYNVFVAHK